MEDKILVEDEKKSNQLYNKGFFGKPLSNNRLELDLYEGLYLHEADRLEVIDEDGNTVGKKEIMKNIPEKRFIKEYPPYKDMRRRGYVLKKSSDPASFRVFPRGGGPGQTPSKYWLCTYREKDNFKIDEVIEDYENISNLNKTMMTALVDEEGDVTYYIFSTIDLKGDVKNYRNDKTKARLYGDLCIIEKPPEELHEDKFYGYQDEDSLRLSLYEALYLVENDILEVEDIKNDKDLDREELFSIAKKEGEGFETKYDVYKDLRDRGLIPKTGFKYGAPFRAYSADPDEKHAEYIVQPVDEKYESKWYQVSRAVRVAHSVRKNFLYGRINGKKVDYLKMKRETP